MAEHIVRVLSDGKGRRLNPLAVALNVLQPHSRELAIVNTIRRRRTAATSGLVADLPVSRRTVSRYLATLHDAGLVSIEQDGHKKIYRATRLATKIAETFETMEAWLATRG